MTKKLIVGEKDPKTGRRVVKVQNQTGKGSKLKRVIRHKEKQRKQYVQLITIALILRLEEKVKEFIRS